MTNILVRALRRSCRLTGTALGGRWPWRAPLGAARPALARLRSRDRRKLTLVRCSMPAYGPLRLRFVAATADQTTPEQRRPTPRRRPGHAGLSDTLTEILTMTFEIRVRNNSNDKICFNSISCCAWMRFNISRGQRRTKRTRRAQRKSISLASLRAHLGPRPRPPTLAPIGA